MLTQALSHDDIGAALLSHPWKFAKTMARIPHWYTLRHQWHEPGLFEAVIEAMRRDGYDSYFGRTAYRYYRLNEHVYWTMGAPVQETILINRAVAKDGHPYDRIADQYDSLFTNEEDLKEDQYVMAMLNLRQNESVLDVGCGTGLLIDHAPWAKPRYLGIDPSGRMLVHLEQRHPDAATIMTYLETFYSERLFDVAVCLFGGLNYVAPEHLHRFTHHVRPGGRFFAMIWKPDYVEPEAHKMTGLVMPSYRHKPEDLSFGPVTVRENRNYLIVEGRI